MPFDFDHPIDRAGTHSVKYDERRAKFGRADVMPLWVADMDFATAPCIREAIAARAAHPVYGYTLAPESLYQSIIDWHAARYEWHIERDWIVLAPGALPALAAVVCALSEPVAGVVVQPPVYAPFSGITADTGRRVVASPLVEANGRYQLNLRHLERCAAEGARLLLLCHPHNPVGRVWPRADLEAIIDVTRRHHFTVVADQLHADITYGDTRFVPIGAVAPDAGGIVSLVSPGKAFNIQGLPLAALVVADPVRREAIRHQLTARCLDNIDPFCLAAAEAAWRHGGAWRDALVAYLGDTRDQAVAYIRDHLAPIRVEPPEAGYLLWLDCRHLGMDDAALQRFFVEDCGLGLNPGTDFGSRGSGFMRLNFGAPRQCVMRALAAIRAALARRGV